MSNASWIQMPPEAALTQVEALAVLRTSEERFRAVVTSGTDVAYCMHADGSEMRQLVGRNFIADAPQPTNNWLAEYIYPEDQTRLLATISGWLRPLHGALAYLLFLTILGHLGVALFHAGVRRDQVFAQMARGAKK